MSKVWLNSCPLSTSVAEFGILVGRCDSLLVTHCSVVHILGGSSLILYMAILIWVMVLCKQLNTSVHSLYSMRSGIGSQCRTSRIMDEMLSNFRLRTIRRTAALRTPWSYRHTHPQGLRYSSQCGWLSERWQRQQQCQSSMFFWSNVATSDSGNSVRYTFDVIGKRQLLVDGDAEAGNSADCR